MAEPEPLESGSRQPPRVPPRVGTATADRGRPRPSGFVPSSRRWAAWRQIVRFLVVTTLCALMLAYAVWRHPFAGGLSLLTAAFLMWRRSRNDSEEVPQPNRRLMYATLLAGIVGEFLAQLPNSASGASIGWVALYSIAIGALIGLWMGWVAWLLHLLSSAWPLLRGSQS
jgi:hypothetical protein